ncbi:hypothetical protein VTK73DRAFT_2927 [Phialemonium thermophilum]|uniref:Uncharacterized protein n=1 Tax=Phialemonium thermophilum TaxID=223376 RepID=A0ABR3VQ67_9PEZI
MESAKLQPCPGGFSVSCLELAARSLPQSLAVYAAHGPLRLAAAFPVCYDLPYQTAEFDFCDSKKKKGLPADAFVSMAPVSQGHLTGRSASSKAQSPIKRPLLVLEPREYKRRLVRLLFLHVLLSSSPQSEQIPSLVSISPPFFCLSCFSAPFFGSVTMGSSHSKSSAAHAGPTKDTSKYVRGSKPSSAHAGGSKSSSAYAGGSAPPPAGSGAPQSASAYTKPQRFVPDGASVYVGAEGYEALKDKIVDSVMLEFLDSGASEGGPYHDPTAVGQRKNHVALRLQIRDRVHVKVGGRDVISRGVLCSVELANADDGRCYIAAKPIPYSGPSNSAIAVFHFAVRRRASIRTWLEQADPLIPYMYTIVGVAGNNAKLLNGCRDWM